jgi:hypothetical protein
LASNLLTVIERIRRNEVDDGDWLYIAGSADDLTLQTEADLGCPGSDEASREMIDPDGFAERGLHVTIDLPTVEDCISWGDRLAGSQDNDAALDIIRYYIRFDAWPETLNPADPPPWDEVQRGLDRKFCDGLGPEDLSNQCRREGCGRGAVKLSAFCRRHHFENIWKRAFPFDE